jgi:hypothetical protein
LVRTLADDLAAAFAAPSASGATAAAQQQKPRGSRGNQDHASSPKQPHRRIWGGSDFVGEASALMAAEVSASAFSGFFN